jgi:hypothetical protein
MKAHELLNDASKWTKEAFARNAEGKECSPQNHSATCFCLLGAVRRCYADGIECSIKQEKIRVAVKKISDGFRTTDWNDHKDRTFEDVRNLLIELDI